MAHDLTEVDEFTTPVTVPDGFDSRNDAAEVVEAIAQALANRTFWLGTHAVIADQDNTLTANNEFAEVIVADKGVQCTNPVAEEAAYAVSTGPHDDVASGNRWKNVLEALIGGGLANANVWSGIPTHDGQLLFTVNATWDAGTQQWSQNTATLASVALMVSLSGKVTLSRKAAGSGAWATWPTQTAGSELDALLVTATTVNAAGSVNATLDVNADRDVTATRYVQAGDDISGGADCIVVGDYLYQTAKNEYRGLNLASGHSSGTMPGVTGTTSISYFDGSKWILNDRGSVSIPVPAPVDGVLKSSRFILHNPSGSGVTYNVSLYRAHGAVFGTSTPPTISVVDNDTDTIAAGATITVTLNWGNLAVAADESYYVYITGAISPPGDYQCKAVEWECTRPGPSM